MIENSAHCDSLEFEEDVDLSSKRSIAPRRLRKRWRRITARAKEEASKGGMRSFGGTHQRKRHPMEGNEDVPSGWNAPSLMEWWWHRREHGGPPEPPLVAEEEDATRSHQATQSHSPEDRPRPARREREGYPADQRSLRRGSTRASCIRSRRV